MLLTCALLACSPEWHQSQTRAALHWPATTVSDVRLYQVCCCETSYLRGRTRFFLSSALRRCLGRCRWIDQSLFLSCAIRGLLHRLAFKQLDGFFCTCQVFQGLPRIICLSVASPTHLVQYRTISRESLCSNVIHLKFRSTGVVHRGSGSVQRTRVRRWHPFLRGA